MHQGRRLAAGAVGEIVGAGAPLVIGTGEAAHAVSVLHGLPGIERAEPHPDGVLVHPDGVPASVVVAALVRAGIPVEQVTRGRRLEDAFLALIGDGASPTGAPPASPLLTGGARVPGPEGSRVTTSQSAPGYHPRRTLPLAVEAVRQLRRRRTMIAFGILLVLPWILIGAFEISGPPAPGSGAPGLVDVATAGGLNFAMFSVFVSAGFLLVVAVALFCGDTVATEASWASLRYLLAAPVPRARLLRQKLIVALGYSTVAVLSLPLMALIAGTIVFGWHPLRLPPTGIDLASRRGPGAARHRARIRADHRAGGGGAGVPVLGVDRLAARRGRRRRRPDDRQQHPRRGHRARARGGRSCPATGSSPGWRRWRRRSPGARMTEGASVSACYALILFAVAFRRFAAKDIVS